METYVVLSWKPVHGTSYTGAAHSPAEALHKTLKSELFTIQRLYRCLNPALHHQAPLHNMEGGEWWHITPTVRGLFIQI